MPFTLTEDPTWFPAPHHALDSPNGLLAIGGDLSPQRLLSAYQQGIFPWYSKGDPLLWWSPDPRALLWIDAFKVPRSLQKTIRHKSHRVLIDQNFTTIIERCQQPRTYEPDTWITDEMKAAYQALFDLGFAHCVEVYQDNELWGGLYGVSIGGAFFGESMFSAQTDGSKLALYYLVKLCQQLGFEWIDCQMWSKHLAQFGTQLVKRDEFLAILSESQAQPTQKGPWQLHDTK